jgi:flagella synthesis protein FlgN
VSLATDHSALRQRLLALLIAETQQVRDFVAVLEQERKILGERDVEPLFALSEHKNRYARLLQQSADARTSLLGQAALKHDKSGVESLLGDPANPVWNNYLKAVAEARALNQANGALLTERLAHNHQALAILMAHSDQPTVYGPDGAARTRPGSRLLGSY